MSGPLLRRADHRLELTISVRSVAEGFAFRSAATTKGAVGFARILRQFVPIDIEQPKVAANEQRTIVANGDDNVLHEPPLFAQRHKHFVPPFEHSRSGQSNAAKHACHGVRSLRLLRSLRFTFPFHFLAAESAEDAEKLNGKGRRTSIGTRCGGGGWLRRAPAEKLASGRRKS